MAKEDQVEFMAAYGLKESGIARLAAAAYELLQLISLPWAMRSTSLTIHKETRHESSRKNPLRLNAVLSGQKLLALRNSWLWRIAKDSTGTGKLRLKAKIILSVTAIL